MLPSWMRSRNCRPRFVYFLAIEITSRRFASTISFLARRACASPTAISRLMSLTSPIDRCVRCSTVRSFSCSRSMSSRRRPSAAECLRLARTCLSSQCRLVSLRGKVSMKSERGMPASRTHSCITDLLDAADLVQVLAQLADEQVEHLRRELEFHELFGELLAQLGRLRVARALLVERLDHLREELGHRREAARGLFRVRAGVDDFLVLAGVLGLLGFVVRLFLGGGGELRVDRIGDHVGRVRIHEADDEVDQAPLAVLDRLVGVEAAGRTWAGTPTGRGARIEAFLDALRDRDLALAREQLDRAHLAHVHAHRVGGAAELGVHRGGERGGGFLGGVFVGDHGGSRRSNASASGAFSYTVMPMSLII